MRRRDMDTAQAKFTPSARMGTTGQCCWAFPLTAPMTRWAPSCERRRGCRKLSLCKAAAGRRFEVQMAGRLVGLSGIEVCLLLGNLQLKPSSPKAVRREQLPFKCSLFRRTIERGRLFGGGSKAVEEAQVRQPMTFSIPTGSCVGSCFICFVAPIFKSWCRPLRRSWIPESRLQQRPRCGAY